MKSMAFEAVAHAVQNCAPDISQSEQRRNWPDYAQRTARYAFGMAGDLDLQKNEKYVEHWQRIEQIVPYKFHFTKKIGNKRMLPAKY